MNNRSYIFSIFYALLFILSLITDWYSILAITLFTTLIIALLDKLGKGIVLRELISIFACFICLIMPLLGYSIYGKDNPLALLWVKYMPIPKERYFSFALPALAAFNLTLLWPIRGKGYSDEGVNILRIVAALKDRLKNMPGIGVYLMIIGVVTFWFVGMMPVSLRFIVTLIYFISFAGLLYVYFSPVAKYKNIVIILFVIFIVGNALRSGMFTVVAYMGITVFSILFIGKKTSLFKKTLLFFLGAFSLLLIQSVKQTYRKFTWIDKYKGSKAVLFVNLMADRISDSKNLFSSDNFFPIYYRTNQGFNVALVMRRIPRVQPYDGGNRLALSFAASLVPRVLWPNKPEAGGKFNMRYYAGVELRGWSTNVGPLGEAYGSFGVTGGIIFMFFLGLFIRWCYKMVFKLSLVNPLLILWIPVLFYQVTYSAESDTLQILNSLFKSALFIWILYKVFPAWFGKTKYSSLARQMNRPVETNIVAH